MRLAEVATDFKGLRKCIHAETIIAIAAGGHAGVPPASVRRHGDDRVLRPGRRDVRYSSSRHSLGNQPDGATARRSDLADRHDRLRFRSDSRDGYSTGWQQFAGWPRRAE